MANGDRQQESLEILKLINAAATTLRLYPNQTAKISDSIESAYHGSKSYLREYGLLRFSLLNGALLLDGEPVNKRIQEKLELLSFDEQLGKLGLNEFILSKGFDRQRFKKILSVFNATPEQVGKAGGIRAFVEQLGLSTVFPEKYIAPGESEEEKREKKLIEVALNELSGGVVRPECVHFLVGKKGARNWGELFRESMQTAETGSRIIATTTYSLLQKLRKEQAVVASPVFSQMLVKINSSLDELQGQQNTGYGEKAAALLTPHLDDALVLILICQQFPTPFGEHYYGALINLIDREMMARVVEWMKGQQEKGESGGAVKKDQLKTITSGLNRFLNTPRGKQILAMGATQDILARTEKDRKEKRLHTGIAALARGDMKSLRNEEVCRSLPSTILKLVVNNKEPLAAAILQNIVSGLKEKDNPLRSSYGQIIGGVAEKLALLQRWDWLEKLTPVCLAWIKETETAEHGFEKYIVAMQAMMIHAWQSNDSATVGRILHVFHQVRSGAAGKAEAMGKIVAHVQEKNADQEFLQAIVESCLEEPFSEDRCQLAIRQGPAAARVLLARLLVSEKRVDRMRLLRILKDMGGEIVPVLLQRLPDRMPWYGKRNILYLLADTGSEGDTEAVLDYITHEDKRVKDEALKCIVQIGGALTQHFLLTVLPRAGVRMKTKVVKHLGNTAGLEIIAPLSELLEDCKLYSGPEKDALVIEISRTLGKTGSDEALNVLQNVLNGGKKQYGREGVDAASQAVAALQKAALKRERGGEPQGGEVEENSHGATSRSQPVQSPPVEKYEPITADPEEEEVYSLLARGDKDGARKKLLQLIEKAVELRLFKEAESLRLRLIDLDPMALTDIIGAAELIEEAKSSSVDQNHTAIWTEWYDQLSSEETSTFYHALTHEKHEKETILVNQGEPQRHVYLVNKGRVKLCFDKGEEEILVQTLGPGQIIGGKAFFDESVWTLNGIAMDDVELSKLTKEDVESWEVDYSGLASKIQDYCLRVDQVNEFFTSSGADRRSAERFPLSTPVRIELLVVDETIDDSIIRGDGNDLSIGGVSFLSRMVRGKDGRALFGQHVRVFLQNRNEGQGEVSFTGSIVAVRNLHSVELGHSVHIQFDRNLEQEELEKLVNSS